MSIFHRIALFVQLIATDVIDAHIRGDEGSVRLLPSVEIAADGEVEDEIEVAVERGVVLIIIGLVRVIFITAAPDA